VGEPDRPRHGHEQRLEQQRLGVRVLEGPGFADTQYDYVFEGYLLFDFTVTDAAGAFSRPLSLDSSLHVLWRTGQRAWTTHDSPIRNVTVTAQAGDWYASNYGTTAISLYGEGEIDGGVYRRPPGR